MNQIIQRLSEVETAASSIIEEAGAKKKQMAKDQDAILQSEGVPKCSCGGRIKPDVVLYEEGLDEENIEEAVRLIREADILIVGGTSLGVYPAAGLIDYYRGHKLVLINKSETPYDNRADLLIHDALGEVFSKIG